MTARAARSEQRKYPLPQPVSRCDAARWIIPRHSGALVVYARSLRRAGSAARRSAGWGAGRACAAAVVEPTRTGLGRPARASEAHVSAALAVATSRTCGEGQDGCPERADTSSPLRLGTRSLLECRHGVQFAPESVESQAEPRLITVQHSLFTVSRSIEPVPCGPM